MSSTKPDGGSVPPPDVHGSDVSVGSAHEPAGAALPIPGAVKPVVRPNLPRTGVDARELARVLARQQAQTGAILPAVDDPPPTRPRVDVARNVAVEAPAPPRAAASPVAAVPDPAPAVPAALRAAAVEQARPPRAPRGMELARAPRALSAMEALDAARAAARATVPGANAALPQPNAPVGPRLSAPRTNTSPFSTARPRVEVPRIEVAPHAPVVTTPAPPPVAPVTTRPDAGVGEAVTPAVARAPRGMTLPPSPRPLSAEEALAAARAAETDAPSQPELVPVDDLPPVSSALAQGAQAALATSLPDVAARVVAVAVVEPRVHLALWKAHRARLAGQGDLRGALAAASIIQGMATRPQHLVFAVVQAAPPRTERYFLTMDLELRVAVAVLPEPERWGVRF